MESKRNLQKIHKRNLKQALSHGLDFKKVHRVIQDNKKVWLKSYIEMDKGLKKQQEMILNNIFSSL